MGTLEIFGNPGGRQLGEEISKWFFLEVPSSLLVIFRLFPHDHKEAKEVGYV